MKGGSRQSTCRAVCAARTWLGAAPCGIDMTTKAAWRQASRHLPAASSGSPITLAVHWQYISATHVALSAHSQAGVVGLHAGHCRKQLAMQTQAGRGRTQLGTHALMQAR